MKCLCNICCFVLAIASAMAQPLHEQALEAGQNYEFDKAKRLYKQALSEAKEVENEELIYMIYERLQECHTSLFQIDSSLLTMKAASRFAQHHGNHEKYLDYQMVQAEIRNMQGQRTKAFQIFLDVSNDVMANSYHRIRANLRLSSIYTFRSDSSKAFYYIEAAQKEALETEDLKIIGSIYESYASIEREFGSSFRAIELYQKAIPYFQSPQKSFRLTAIYRKISYIFQNLGNWDKAVEFCQLALEVAIKSGSEINVAHAQSLLGELLLEKKDYKNSKKHFIDALNCLLQKNKRDKTSVAYSHLSAIETLSGHQAEAFNYLQLSKSKLNHNTGLNTRFLYYLRKMEYLLEFEKGSDKMRAVLDSCIMIADQSDSENNKQHALKAQVEYFKKIEDFESALVAREEHNKLTLKIRKKNQSQMVHDLEAKYKNVELDKAVSELNSINLLNETKLNQQKLIIYSVLGALILFALFGYFVYRLYKKVNLQNETIEKALAEKELLLKEIHHRVKNNLQVISSLLSLQSGYISDDKAVQALKHGQDRVQSMALIHQDLYQTDNLNGVNTQRYFEKLVENLYDSYRVDEGDINMTLDVDPIMLDVDSMIPLGLVVNELVSNVLKHAFNGQSDAEVNLSLKEIDDTLILHIQDNGVGLKDINELSGDTFGFQMIKAFTNKLKASMKVNHEEGFGVQMLIKNYAKTS